MEVVRLELIDFRNYQSASCELSSGLNLILGSNGQGKTNLLESVHILSSGGSHRTSSTAPVVRHGAERAVVRSLTSIGRRSISIDAEIKLVGGVRMLVNKVPPERGAGSPLLTVVFSPEDLTLIKGGPEERRRFLDVASAKARPRAAADRQEFERVLKQRNGVLKAAQINPRAASHLEVWSEQLVKAGAAVISNRLDVLTPIGRAASERYRHVAGSGAGVALSYESSIAPEIPSDQTQIEELLRAEVARNQERDIERGVSSAGPHRDDMLITIESRDTRLFASQGEQRSVALALRLAEHDLIKDSRGEDPVLLLDDVFSELDDTRRHHLSELVSGASQTIATATSAAGIPIEAGRTLLVDGGKVIEP